MKNYHCCATCINFEMKREENGIVARCKRLGFETKTNYVFNCWTPKEHIKKLMEKQN